MSKTTAEFTVYEPFTFADGVRWAWVTYRREAGRSESRCVGVREAKVGHS